MNYVTLAKTVFDIEIDGLRQTRACLDENFSRAVEAIVKCLGNRGKVVVIGQDAELVACQRIAAGTQAATIYKPTSLEVWAALEAAVKMAKGRPVVARDEIDNGFAKIPTILRDTIVVTKENLMETVVKDKYHSYDDVYNGVPADQRPRRP